MTFKFEETLRHGCLKTLSVFTLLFLIQNCGQLEPAEMQQREYIVLQESHWGLSRQFFSPAIDVCIQPSPHRDQERAISWGLSTWLSPLRHLSDRVVTEIRFRCENHHMDVLWNTEKSGRAYVETNRNRPKVYLWSNSNSATILHELGHAFGLGDSYFYKGSDSIMRRGRFAEAKLYPPDIKAIQEIFVRVSAG
jgi:hypothetical protein